ncbi:MAG: NUDIX domain-containing protein [Novosphingobium sp.]
MSRQIPPVTSEIGEYPAPHLAVDIVLVTIHDGDLAVLMHARTSEPFAGQLVLPGGFVHPGELLDDTAKRVLREKAGLSGIAVEQLYTFSDPQRDPRGWVVSVAYFALVPYDRLQAAMSRHANLELVAVAPCSSPPSRKTGKPGASRQRSTAVALLELSAQGQAIVPGFDHMTIVTTAIERLRGKLDWSMVAFGLLPARFTLYDLQRVHECILGRALNKPHFRKRMLERQFPDGRRLRATGAFFRGGRQRPAELYELKE